MIYLLKIKVTYWSSEQSLFITLQSLLSDTALNMELIWHWMRSAWFSSLWPGADFQIWNSQEPKGKECANTAHFLVGMPVVSLMLPENTTLACLPGSHFSLLGWPCMDGKSNNGEGRKSLLLFSFTPHSQCQLSQALFHLLPCSFCRIQACC